LLIVVSAILTVYCSCGHNNKAGHSEQAVPSVAQAPAERPEPAARKVSPGEEAFRKNCLTCHQADGSGVPDMYPPLHNADIVKGPPEGIIKAILFGLKGPTVINGTTYTQPMPAQNLLSDSTIAILVTYVKQKWDSTEVSVTPEDVRKIRAGGRH
jgi:mono/diheme cytochrome c family protein